MHGVQAMTTTTMLSFIFSQLSQLYNSKAGKLHFVLLLMCLLQLIFHQFEHQPGYHWFIYFQCTCCIKLYLFPPWRLFWFEVPPALQKFQLNFILYMYIHVSFIAFEICHMVGININFLEPKVGRKFGSCKLQSMGW